MIARAFHRILPLLLCFFFGCTKSFESSKDFFTDDLSARNCGLIGDSINVKNFGAEGNGFSDDSPAFLLAMEQAYIQKKPLYIPAGFYQLTLTLTHDSLHIIGQRRPGSDLNNGVVILGSINANSKKHILISNLGIDARGRLADQDDAALSSGTTGSSQALYQTFSDLVVIGNGLTEKKHGILCQAGTDISIKNVFVYGFYHGIALRSGNINLDSAKISYCQRSSVIIKSDIGNLLTQNVSINHITITGDIATGGGAPVLVQSYGNAACITRNITIQHVVSEFGDRGCIEIQETAGKISGITVLNCKAVSQSGLFSNAHYEVTGGTDIRFDSCVSVNAAGFAFRTSEANNVRVMHADVSGAKTGNWSGTFSYLQINGIEIIK